MPKPRRREATSGRGAVLSFIARCALYWGASVWLVGRFRFIERWGINLTVATLDRVFAALGAPAGRAGSAITAGGANVNIVAECSPHMPFLIFAAAVLAFPATWRQRLLGLMVGAALIHAFNTLRIMTLIWILAWRSSWFDFVHVYLWQTGTVLVVFATFALWLRLLARPSRSA